MIEINEALALIAGTVKSGEATTIPLSQAVGRILAAPVLADVDSPPHTKSIMDGFAVRAEDVKPGATFELKETIIAGDVPTKPIATGTCSRIMTGAPMPAGADAVIMVEQSNVDSTSTPAIVEFQIDHVPPGRHIVEKAASFAKGEQIFPAGHSIRPLDIGLLAEIGCSQISVASSISAAVLPTGNELVDASQIPTAGKIRNSNGPMLIAMLNSLQISTADLGIGRDERDDLAQKIERGLQHDLLILSGGVSAGTMDLVPELLQKAGVEQVFHKVKVKPGKPIWFGSLQRAGQKPTYVFGLPGNPVSSLVGFRLFVRTAIDRLNGIERPIMSDAVSAELTTGHQTRGDRPTYWPSRLTGDNSATRQIEPLKWLGSSDLRALEKANALAFFPADKEHHEAGECVRVLPL